MSISLASIRKDAVVKAPRIILLGREKIGKSSFATGCRFENGILVESGLNRPIVLPIKGEEGVDDIAVAKFPIARKCLPVREATMIEKAIKYDASAPFTISDLHAFVHSADLPGERDIHQFWLRTEPLFRLMLEQDLENDTQ